MSSCATHMTLPLQPRNCTSCQLTSLLAFKTTTFLSRVETVWLSCVKTALHEVVSKQVQDRHACESCRIRKVVTWHMCMQPELQGVLPILDGKLGALQRSAVQWPNSLKQCAAICNSLNMISKWQVAGDEADIAAFKACEASFLVRHTAGTVGFHLCCPFAVPFLRTWPTRTCHM